MRPRFSPVERFINSLLTAERRICGHRQPLAQTRDRQNHRRLLAARSSTIRRDGLFGDGDGVQSAS